MSIRLDGTSLRDVRSPTGYCRSHQFADTVAFCSSFPELLRNNGRNEDVNNMENQAGIRGGRGEGKRGLEHSEYDSCGPRYAEIKVSGVVRGREKDREGGKTVDGRKWLKRRGKRVIAEDNSKDVISQSGSSSEEP